ncbi:MAG: cation:proton antiporter [Acetobacteraceae bacterium]|nr:cation:proton antiporter [Acetobacteraceae bacterium]
MAPMISGDPFAQLAGLLVLAAAAGLVGLMLRQPLIVSFLAVGLVAGPGGLGLVHHGGHLELLAELGVALLLFLVGLKLDVGLVRSLGLVSLTTGLGQVAFTAGFGVLICLGLGMDALTSLYVAVALTFSSTIIIVKLLSDKREIDSLHGRIALGFLIVQDLVVVLAMVVLSAFGVGARGGGIGDLARVFGAGLGLLLLVLLFVRFAAAPLSRRLARAPELLLAFSVALAAMFAAIGEAAGFGKELGGLLAGAAMGSTPVRDSLASRLAPLRDFLLLFFFVALGAGLDPGALGQQAWPALVLSAFVLVGNPLIVMAILAAMGYRRRTGFLAGLTVAQISEFSLVFMAVGVSLGHVAEGALALVTLVGLVTIAASTYMIAWSHHLYVWCEPLLGPFERRDPFREREDRAPPGQAPEVLLFGLGRYGGAIAERLRRRGVRVLGVDFNPEAVRAWQGRGLHALYGDATDPEFLAHLPLCGARWAVSAVPERDLGVAAEDARLSLIQGLRAAGFAGRIAVTCQQGGAAAERLRAMGADLVLEPFQDAADQAVALICGGGRPERTREEEPAEG